MTLVIIIVWRKHILIALAFFCTFIFIEGIYFSATLFKIPHGAPVFAVRPRLAASQPALSLGIASSPPVERPLGALFRD